MLALMTLTAVATGMTTYAVLRHPELWGGESRPSFKQGAASPDYGINDKELFKFNKAFNLIEDHYLLPAERAKLLDGAIRGMVEALGDPFSVYKSKDEAESFSDELQGAFTGIGANLSIVHGQIVVESTIKGTPAERAGLRPNDVLVSINGDSLQGLSLSEAIAKIRGPKGTKAKLGVRRQGEKETLNLELVRDRIDLATVSSDIDAEGIGYLAIHKFNYDTAASVAGELADLEKRGLKALVVDLRDNPGGMVQAVEEVASQFLPKGSAIMQYEYRDGTVQTEAANEGLAAPKPYPLVVLINKESASAAEILAGALRQSAGAVLVGETTYGKGTVQIPYDKDLEDGSIMKLTVSKWLLPDGTWVNGKGIAPDVPVSQPAYYLATTLPRDVALKLDDAGAQVANLQAVLAGVGYPADREDGYFSQGTQEAIKAFQKAEGLPVTGIADEATADRLEESLYERLQQKQYDAQWIAALGQARGRIAASR